MLLVYFWTLLGNIIYLYHDDRSFTDFHKSFNHSRYVYN